LYDPHGETAALLDSLGVAYREVTEPQSLDCDDLRNLTIAALSTEILIIGKNALDLSGNGIDLSAVPDGLRVIVFEQTAEVLEKRLGFRTAEYGLRNVFKRVPDHPVLRNLENDHLRDWRGASTLLPERLEYKTDDNVFNGAPTVEWCGLTVPRVWRSGNRGSVASVLIEKPVCGDFLPIIDGGFSLQYSPLMEYRHGKGMILFCQMDVTGRTENDPAATHLVGNILRYVNEWKAPAKQPARYIGDITGKELLEKIGVVSPKTETFSASGSLDPLTIFGPGSVLHTFARDGGKVPLVSWHRNAKSKVLILGFNQDELKTAFPELTVQEGEHISTYFEPFGMDSPLRGVSPADLHNRDPRDYPLVQAEPQSLDCDDSRNLTIAAPSIAAPLTEIAGNGILAVLDDGRTVVCGIAPWQFASDEQSFKRTFRRSAFVLSRLLGNMNVDMRTPLIDRFHGVVGADEKRWLDGLYLDQPEEWDDPYRFFRW